MAKDMYQKREERKNKKMENDNNQGGLHKTSINWLITIYLTPLSNPYK